jgi:uncharacterized coiled-coil protein SlyX
LPNQAKQRFLSLDVAEVSVVDTPANEVEFLVHKRASEDTTMGDTNTSATAPAAVEKSNQPEVISQPATASTEAAEKAMAQVTALVEGIAKAAGATIVDPEEAREAEVEKARKGMGAMRKTYREQLKQAGLKGDAMKSAMAAFDKCAMMEAEMSKEATKDASTTKSADKPTELTPEQQASVVAQKALEELSQSITKGKMFTKERQDKMKAALDQLKAVMDEMGTVPTGASPATSTPDTTTFGASGVAELTKSLTELKDQISAGMAEISKRVEAVEKTRTPGNALPSDGTDGKPAPVKKSLWTGIL